MSPSWLFPLGTHVEGGDLALVRNETSGNGDARCPLHLSIAGDTLLALNQLTAKNKTPDTFLPFHHLQKNTLQFILTHPQDILLSFRPVSPSSPYFNFLLLCHISLWTWLSLLLSIKISCDFIFQSLQKFIECCIQPPSEPAPPESECHGPFCWPYSSVSPDSPD